MEILVEGEEGERLQLAEHASEGRFNPVDVVKKAALVHLQLGAAEGVVRSQEKVIAKDLVLQIGKGPFADKQEIGDVFLIFAAPATASAGSPGMFQVDLGYAFFFRGAFAKAPIAGAKNRAHHTRAG